MFLFKNLFALCTFLALLLSPILSQANGETTDIMVQKLLETERSWDGSLYQKYPAGTPQLSVLKITIPPHSSLPWHEHLIPNAAYVLNGVLTVEKKATGETRTLKAGEVLPEMVGSAHRGYTGAEGVTLIVFYAGQQGIALSKPSN